LKAVYELKHYDQDKAPPRHIQIALQYGLLRLGWNIKDYVVHAALTRDGYEVIVVIGVQRSGKSNESLQISSWAKEATIKFRKNNVDINDYLQAVDVDGVYPSDFIDALPVKATEREIWSKVLADLVFKASSFVAHLKAVPDREPLDSLDWDDIAGHYTNMEFRLDPQAYAQVDSAITVLGTKAKVIITNIPNMTRLARNIKDHTTMEIFIGRNKLRKMMRIFRLPGLKYMDMNLFKADVEPPSMFDLYKVPDWAWEIYEGRRIELAKEVFEVLGETVGFDKAPEGYLSVPEAIILAKDMGVDWGVSTIQQNASRGVWKKIKVGGYMFIEEKSYKRMLEAQTYKRNLKED